MTGVQVDMLTGALRWRYSCLVNVSESGPVVGGAYPLNMEVVDGVVLAGCSNQELHALNATTGLRLWRLPCLPYNTRDAEAMYGNGVSHGGVFYFGCSNNVT